MELISIIVPFYNEEKTVVPFINELKKTILTIKKYDFEIIFVDDGSKDDTLALLKKHTTFKNHQIISLTRNFGQDAAINAGIDNCHGDAAIILDGDLQDPPEYIPQLIDKWKSGYDVVNIKRINRKHDRVGKRVTAKLFYKLISHWSDKVDIVENVNNFRIISKRVINVIKHLTSKNKVFRFDIPFAGFKTTNIEIQRPPRYAGTSHYSLAAMSRLAIDSIVSISTQPLNLISKMFLILLALFSASAITEIILFVVQKTTFSLSISSICYLAWLIINCCLLFTLIILLAVAIVAQYVARIHIETQNRPTYIINKIISK